MKRRHLIRDRWAMNRITRTAFSRKRHHSEAGALMSIDRFFNRRNYRYQWWGKPLWSR